MADVNSIEKKYAGPIRYIAFSEDPHHLIIKTAARIKSAGQNGNSLKILESIGDYFAEIAPIAREQNLEYRWRTIRRSENDAESEYSGQKTRRSEGTGRRSEDSPDRERYSKTELCRRRYEGAEEHIACMIYSIANPAKRDKFLDKQFNKKVLGNQIIIGSYHIGQCATNNILFETLLLGEKAGRAIALGMAGTLERMVDGMIDDSEKENCFDKSGLVSEAARTYFIAGKTHYAKYISRLSKLSPSLAEDLGAEDPKRFTVCLGSLSEEKELDQRLKYGTTFSDKLEVTKREVKKMLGIVLWNPVTRTFEAAPRNGSARRLVNA